MRAVIQRVSSASVTVEGAVTGAIEQGLLILLGVGRGDDEDDLVWLSEKIADLRIFADDDGRFARSVIDVNGGCLVVSQFTLFASTRKGTRPGFSHAAEPERAEALYKAFCAHLTHATGRAVATGLFGAHMAVALVNDGPVTISIDTRNRE
ncbi:MAG: D-aminoacyl-tRNA deacylase [Planctomycetota bacterium]|jgi:D-tyrosyl-tRNA(Tyr) deacylase|nr:D-aminoacyl-tRNA deacylase [Planctomycetota bacterium]